MEDSKALPAPSYTDQVSAAIPKPNTWQIEQPGHRLHGIRLSLLTKTGFEALPLDTTVYSIFGERMIKGVHDIAFDERGGYIAFGLPIDPLPVEIPARQYPLDANTSDDLRNRFSYHAPKPDQLPRYASLRAQAFDLAGEIMTKTPKSREQSLALTHLETAIFFANAAIARNE